MHARTHARTHRLTRTQVVDELKSRPVTSENERREMLAILKRMQEEVESNEECKIEQVCAHLITVLHFFDSRNTCMHANTRACRGAHAKLQARHAH